MRVLSLSGWNQLDLWLVIFRLLMLPLNYLPNGGGAFMNAFARLLFLIRPLRVLGKSLSLSDRDRDRD